MKQTLFALSLGLFSCAALAHDMVPASAQSQPILIHNARVHTALNGVLDATDVLFDKGKIVAIGQQLPQAGAKVIDANGQDLYPGLIALDTSIGIVEVEMMRASNDAFEVGDSNPQLLAVSAFNPDSELIPTIRVNGITHAQVVPQGDALAGQSSLVSLDSWTIEDALVSTAPQFHLYWPAIRYLSKDKEVAAKQLKARDEQMTRLAEQLEDGYRYYLADKAGTVQKLDNRWQAALPLYQGKASLFIHANRSEEIERAIAMTRPYGFKLVFVGGYDAWRLADQLGEIGASVIYNRTLSLPMRKDEPVEMSFKIPALLKQAGVPFAIGFSGDWNARNLPFAAGQAAAYGLSKEEALKSITLNAAKILGVNDMGAIAVGYRANLVLSKGDILDPAASKIDAVFIDGRQIDLNNRQQQLYQKYLKR